MDFDYFLDEKRNIKCKTTYHGSGWVRQCGFGNPVGTEKEKGKDDVD